MPTTITTPTTRSASGRYFMRSVSFMTVPPARRRSSAIARLPRRVEAQLEETEIQPAPELEPGLANDACVGESERLVQRDARVIFHVDAGNHKVVLLRARTLDQCLHQQAPQALAAVVPMDIDPVFHRVLVGRPRTEASIACEAQQLAVVGFRADDGKAVILLRLEPSHHGPGRAGGIVIERRGTEDRVVQDVQDGTRVGVIRAVNDLHFTLPGWRPPTGSAVRRTP